MEFGETADRLGLARVVGQNLGIDRRRSGRVAFGGRLPPPRPEAPPNSLWSGPTSRSMKPRIWLSGSAPTNPSTGWPLSKAITAGIDWMPSWPAICGCSSMFILTSVDLAAGIGDRLLQRRRQLLARAAPRRPEIDQNRLARRRRQHVGAERGRRDVLDRARFGLRRDARRSHSPCPIISSRRRQARACPTLPL